MTPHFGKGLKYCSHAITFLFLITSANAFQSLKSFNEIASKQAKRSKSNHITSKIVMESFKRQEQLFMSTNQEKKKDLPDISMEKNFDPLSLSSESQAMDSFLSDEINDKNDASPSIGIWTARGLLLLVAVLWGTNFASVKYLENLCFHPPCSHPPSEAALARFGVASLVSLPLLLNQRKDIILAGFECGIWITLGYFTQALALSTVPSGKCAFICSLTVVVVPILSAVFFGKPIKKVNIISAALALSGVGILEGLVDFKELLGVYPAIADTETPSLMAETILHTSTAEPAVNVVSSSLSKASTDAVASVTDMGGWIASAMASTESIKGDLIALGQPFGFGLAFMRIEHYVEKFKDVENRVLTISAAQCVAVGFLSFLWVLYDYHGIIPNMEYMVCASEMSCLF